MRKVLAAVAFVLLVVSGTGALAQPAKPTSVCYHVSLSMWGSVILPEQKVCVRCPIVGCPHLPDPPSIIDDES